MQVQTHCTNSETVGVLYFGCERRALYGRTGHPWPSRNRRVRPARISPLAQPKVEIRMAIAIMVAPDWNATCITAVATRSSVAYWIPRAITEVPLRICRPGAAREVNEVGGDVECDDHARPERQR